MHDVSVARHANANVNATVLANHKAPFYVDDRVGVCQIVVHNKSLKGAVTQAPTPRMRTDETRDACSVTQPKGLLRTHEKNKKNYDFRLTFLSCHHRLNPQPPRQVRTQNIHPFQEGKDSDTIVVATIRKDQANDHFFCSFLYVFVRVCVCVFGVRLGQQFSALLCSMFMDGFHEKRLLFFGKRKTTESVALDQCFGETKPHKRTKRTELHTFVIQRQRAPCTLGEHSQYASLRMSIKRAASQSQTHNVAVLG